MAGEGELPGYHAHTVSTLNTTARVKKWSRHCKKNIGETFSVIFMLLEGKRLRNWSESELGHIQKSAF